MAFWTASAKRAALAIGLALPLLGGMTVAASAQGLIEFLWGGDEEHGGKRELVGFSREYKAGQIIVSFADRRLYHIVRDGQAMSYPIAVPREQSRWEGTTQVSSKRENPDWTPTPDMFKENPRLPSWVPGGHPMNPLGVRALYLGSSTYRIHGTDAPWTIGQAVSKGCIRMYNQDVLHLYPKVPVGTKVLVTWKNFKVGSVIASADDKVETMPASSRSPAATLYTKKVSDQRAYDDDEQTTDAKPEPYAKAERGKAEASAATGEGNRRRVHGIPVDESGKPKEGFFVYPDESETADSDKSDAPKRKSSTPSKTSASQKTAQVHE